MDVPSPLYDSILAGQAAKGWTAGGRVMDVPSPLYDSILAGQAVKGWTAGGRVMDVPSPLYDSILAGQVVKGWTAGGRVMDVPSPLYDSILAGQAVKGWTAGGRVMDVPSPLYDSILAGQVVKGWTAGGRVMDVPSPLYDSILAGQAVKGWTAGGRVMDVPSPLYDSILAGQVVKGWTAGGRVMDVPSPLYDSILAGQAVKGWTAGGRVMDVPSPLYDSILAGQAVKGWTAGGRVMDVPSPLYDSILAGQAVKGWTAGGRVMDLINTPRTMPLTGGDQIPEDQLRGSIEFRDVQFAYPSRPGSSVFTKLNLGIPARSTVALCGPSGQGKSTMAALLERFYDVEEGAIFIDGRDIRSLDPNWLRGHLIGFISQAPSPPPPHSPTPQLQEPVLFSGTVAENIRYGKPGATEEEVERAARAANAHDFITSFSHGYDTHVGERGAQLSGGQKQRIAIARALVKNPVILILDEATSALDPASEAKVKDALERASEGRTVLIIAHRLSTIQHAASIAVVKDGGIAEEGSHEELMKKKGVYYQNVTSQFLI